MDRISQTPSDMSVGHGSFCSGALDSEMSSPMPDNVVTIGLRSLWEHEMLIDYTIQTEGRTFQVHKVVLAAVSDYFRTMLTGSTNMAESQRGIAVIEGVSASVMEILLKFVYKNQLDLTKDNVTDILAGAMYLQMSSVTDLCTEFMMNHIDIDNWFDSLSLFRMYNLQDAVEQIMDYIRQDIRDIVKKFDSGLLGHDDLWFFVNNWQSSDWDLFHYIKCWACADFDTRKEHIDDLLNEVRYALMTPKELELIKATKMCSDSASTCLLVEDALSYHNLPIYRKVLDVSEQTQVRTPSSFVIFSGHNSTSGGYMYDAVKDRRFIEHKGLRIPDSFGLSFRQIEINNYLVVCTSNDPEEWFIFNPRTLQWAKMANLPRELNGAKLVHDDAYLYTVGGSFEHHYTQIINRIDRYDFFSNTWSEFSILPEDLVDFGSCVCQGGLYVSGGNPADDAFTDNSVASVHCLDLTTQIWTAKAAMLEPRCFHSMHAMKILGEEVMCIFDKTYNLEYYSPSKDQWARCTFSFNDQLPIKNTMGRYFRGNLCFICNATVSTEFSAKRSACVLLEFPEEGTDATVDYLYEYDGEMGLFVDRTVLSVLIPGKKTKYLMHPISSLHRPNSAIV